MTDDIKALVAELRTLDTRMLTQGCTPACPNGPHQHDQTLYGRAADTIEALEAEVEDLKKWWGRSVRATEKREQERDAYAAVIALALADSWPVKHDQTAHMRSALMQAPEDTLAARDRLVAAEALRSASSLTTDDDYVFRSTDDVRDWLRVRADQIESP